MKALPVLALLLSALVASCASNKPVAQVPPASTEAAPAQASMPVQQPASPAQAPATAPQSAPTAASDASPPTRAENDYGAIYGTASYDYDPVADPTLPPPAAGAPPSYDPWEKWNRKVHRFNNGVDRYVAKPLATAYVNVVPRPVRNGVHNFFDNLGKPLTVVTVCYRASRARPGMPWAAS